MINHKELSYELVKSRDLQNGDTILVGSKFLHIGDIRFCVGMGHFEYGEYMTVIGTYLERYHDGWKATTAKTIEKDFYLYRDLPVIKVTNRNSYEEYRDDAFKIETDDRRF